jgi:hypothetical protein
MFFDETTGRLRWRWVAAGGVLLLAAVAGAIGLVSWLLLREVLGPGSDAAKARSEVQRMYDSRWPGRVRVEKCTYVKDPEGSIFDMYECRIAVRCRRALLFSVPRADAFVRSDSDPVPPGAGLPRCER